VEGGVAVVDGGRHGGVECCRYFYAKAPWVAVPIPLATGKLRTFRIVYDVVDTEFYDAHEMRWIMMLLTLPMTLMLLLIPFQQMPIAIRHLPKPLWGKQVCYHPE